nr:MAG TPA: hypothetical protein [Caudoviricetes sp.]
MRGGATPSFFYCLCTRTVHDLYKIQLFVNSIK